MWTDSKKESEEKEEVKSGEDLKEEGRNQEEKHRLKV